MKRQEEDDGVKLLQNNRDVANKHSGITAAGTLTLEGRRAV